MPLTFLLGGARSGKSQLALRLAAGQAAPVVFLATGEGRDEEMAERIERHRLERPAAWQTVEEPVELASAIAAVAPESCLVIDCLALWVSNLCEQLPASAIEQRAAVAARAAADRPGPTFAVSNEVGLGIVPAYPLGRAYRDLLGRVNVSWADAAERAFFVIAGQALALESAARLLEPAAPLLEPPHDR